MSIHTPITQSGIYFITFTCHDWLPLIELTNGYQSVYNWFDILSTKGHSVNGYVIMPNHLHLLLHYTGIGSSLNTLISNGKRFMAYDIIRELESRQQTAILTRLQNAVHPSDKKNGKKHSVWINSFDVKECRTEKFVLQKLTYLHNNPCAGKWKLADSPVEYIHSSASFYNCGKKTGYAVKDYREFL